VLVVVTTTAVSAQPQSVPPDLLAEWYRRNMRIFNNATNLVTSPHDRVLVIFGAGHLGWLRQPFGSDPTFRLRNLEEFAR
jgi:hypothetical protein